MVKEHSSKKYGLSSISLIIGGIVSLMLGVLGMFLPLLPTTPFLLLAAYCFARSSKKLYRWTVTNKWFGDYIKNYIEGKGVPIRQKVFTVIFLWVSIGYSISSLELDLWVQLMLLGIATGVTVHIFLIKIYKKK